MADEIKNGPKDTTPNPLDEVVKASGENESKDNIAGVADDVPKEENVFAGRQMFRAVEIIFAISGVFFMFIALSGKYFSAVPALIGALCFVASAVTEALYTKRFAEDTTAFDINIRYILAGIPGLLALLYFVEIFKPFSMKLNSEVIIYALVAAAAVFAVNFFVYLKSHKEKIISDILMFISSATGLVAVFVFYYYYVVPAIALALMSMILLLYSLNKDKFKSDKRLGMRVIMSVFSILSSGLILLYASTVFTYHKANVINYAAIGPSHENEPKGLNWSNNSWSLVYTVSNPKKGASSVNIIHGLTRGVTEIPNIEDKDVKLPRYIDKPFWNRKGNMIIFTAGEEENGPRDVWGISVDLALLNLPDKARKEFLDYARPSENLPEKSILAHPPTPVQKYTGIIDSADAQIAKLEYEKKKKRRPDLPPGRPKTLITTYDKIISGQNIKPIVNRFAWSPSDKNFVIAASTEEDNGAFNLWTADTTEQSMSRITNGDNKIMPMWSPDDSRILYVSKIDSYTYLEIRDADGKNPRELRASNKKDSSLFPVWNAAENKVIYISKGNFMIMNANATDQKILTKETYVDSPYWLTEKKQKVYLRVTESGDIWRIFTVTPEGEKNTEIFRRAAVSISQPKWSFDGSAIATGVNKKDSGEIWTLDKDGSNQAKLFETKHEVSELEWSPQSNKIAFIVKKRDEGREEDELWVVDRDGQNPTLAYSGEGVISHLTWDGFGKNLAFQEKVRRWYFNPEVINVKIVNAIDGEEGVLLPYEFMAKNPVWTDDGDAIAYVGWDNFLMPSNDKRVWIARVQ